MSMARNPVISHKKTNLARMVFILLTAGMLIPLEAQEPVPLSDSIIQADVRQMTDALVNGPWFIGATGYQKRDSTEIERVEVSGKPERIRVYADRQLAYSPFRESVLDTMEQRIRSGLGEGFGEYTIEFYSGRVNLRDLVPNYYRTDEREVDRQRTVRRWRRRSPPLVENLSRSTTRESNLYNINIALWHSHGWYYEPTLNRWEWQRARIFQTVEDIYPMSYTLPFLIPMLENAGANVFVPRERDWQVHEVVVDNDGSSGKSLFIASENVLRSADSTGFALGEQPYVEENPFRLGTYSVVPSERDATAFMQWIPEIPEEGYYAVYLSFHGSEDNVDAVRYTVHHDGGSTEFAVNQQMGGGTWIYLGRFKFREGFNPEQGSVVLSNQYDGRSGRITADAVRFGGGMGNIARNGLTSNRPRYQEGARYYLQYAGFPDTLVWKLNPSNDYNDDYQSRGEWVNYLLGAPSGPQADRNAKGLGIPVDLSLAFHTDAGISDNDTVIGTLGIYSTNYDGGYFPSGISRMASRDLTDLVQTQIVEDLRSMYDSAWTRRGMWDRGYSESFRPNVPAMLLELFSHQNFLDMRFGQEPQFRFDVSRAVYKGILKFLHAFYGTGYVVQPLPVEQFTTELLPDGGIRLKWKATSDPLEPTAEAESFMVYTRINDHGFDNGNAVTGNEFTLEEPMADSIYSFRVTAVNGGGESFPSEVLSACRVRDEKGRVLIINAFDRTGGSAWFDDTRYAGFLQMVDQGVPNGVDLHTVGAQFDFVKSSPWLDDDSPGHGASYADLEALVIPGNTFDFTAVHGSSIRHAGYSFVSVTDESVTRGEADLAAFDMVDFLAGEERTSYYPKDTSGRFRVLTDSMIMMLEPYLEQGGNLFISGAHIASDMHALGQDSIVEDLLRYRWRTSNASRVGDFYFMDPGFAAVDEVFHFNTGIHPRIYTVEGADALEPADSTATTLIRYRENNMSAAVAWKGDYRIVAMGFPFETITDQHARDLIMEKIIRYMKKPDGDE